MNGERLAATIGRNVSHRPKMLSSQKLTVNTPMWVLTMLASAMAAVLSVVRPRSLGDCDTILQGYHADVADQP